MRTLVALLDRGDGRADHGGRHRRAANARSRARQENPAHYAKIERVLAAAERVPAFQLREWLPTAVGASDVVAAPLWLVSDPPKMKLAFTLDATRYTAAIGRFPPAQPKPAR